MLNCTSIAFNFEMSLLAPYLELQLCMTYWEGELVNKIAHTCLE